MSLLDIRVSENILPLINCWYEAPEDILQSIYDASGMHFGKFGCMYHEVKIVILYSLFNSSIMAARLILYLMITILPVTLSSTEANPLSGRHLRVLVAEVEIQIDYNSDSNIYSAISNVLISCMLSQQPLIVSRFV